MKMDEYRREFLKMAGLAVIGQSVCFAKQPARADWDNTSGKRSFFDVRSFGASGNGKTIDTPAINAAIEAAAAAGGGTVVFPAGTYVCFSIHLRSFVALFLQQGATILAADSPLPGPDHRLHGRHLRRRRAQDGLGRLPGLRPQSLAQLAALGREHPRRRDLRAWAYLGQGPQPRRRPQT